MTDGPPTFEFHSGNSPLVVSIPHGGEYLPDEIAGRLTDAGRRLADTDWHTLRLYGFARDLGASVFGARMSRYVVDLNRPPDNTALYQGADNTTVVPISSFDQQPLYAAARPTPEEIAQRIADYHAPYHAALAEHLSTVRRRHGFAVLFDAHSIRGEVPRFFAGQLPDLNLGTNDGQSCARRLETTVADMLERSPYTSVVNGRFKGGYITRHYGDPARSVHALQLEIAQRTYMDEQTFAFVPERAEALQQLLRRILSALVDWTPSS